MPFTIMKGAIKMTKDILVIDSDREIFEAIRNSLQDEMTRVFHVLTVEDALEKLNTATGWATSEWVIDKHNGYHRKQRLYYPTGRTAVASFQR